MDQHDSPPLSHYDSVGPTQPPIASLISSKTNPLLIADKWDPCFIIVRSDMLV